MERRKAITAAAATSLTMLAGAAGIALNSGILGASADTGADDNVGRVSLVDTTTTTTAPPITVYVDDPTAPTAPTAPTTANASPTAAPFVQPTTSQPVTTSTASGYQDDDSDEDEGEGEDGQETEDRDEYEGAEDDD